MKQKLFHEVNNRMVINQKYVNILKEYKIRLKTGKSNYFFIFYNEEIMNKFLNDFELIPDVVCAVKKFSKGETFVYYSKKKDPELLFRGGIVGSNNGFLGKGIYCISEKDFEENGLGELNVKRLLENSLEKGEAYGITTVIFQYTGPYLISKYGKGTENIINLLTNAVGEEEVIAVLEENIDIII